MIKNGKESMEGLFEFLESLNVSEVSAEFWAEPEMCRSFGVPFDCSGFPGEMVKAGIQLNSVKFGSIKFKKFPGGQICRIEIIFPSCITPS